MRLGGPCARACAPRPTSSPGALHRAAVKANERVVWFDYAKGMCILLVVMMHSTLGVGDAMGREGFMHYVVAFAKPFRMPDFFLLSGLFLFRLIDRDWRTYLDRKLSALRLFLLPVAPHHHRRQGWAGAGHGCRRLDCRIGRRLL